MRYPIKLIAAMVLALGVAFSSSTSFAGLCGFHESIVKQLEEGYQEVRTGYGLAGNGALVELFVSAKKGTWTFILTRPDGFSCLMASGGSWETMIPIDIIEEEVM